MTDRHTAFAAGVENAASGAAWDPAGRGIIPPLAVTSVGDPDRDRLFGAGYALALHGFRETGIPSHYRDYMEIPDFRQGFDHGRKVAASYRDALAAFDEGFNASPRAGAGDRSPVHDVDLYMPRPIG